MGTFTGARRYVLHTFAHTAQRADEEARRAVHAQHRVPGVRRQAPAPRGAVGHLRRARHRRDLAPAAEAAGRRILAPHAEGTRTPACAAARTASIPSARSRPGASPRTLEARPRPSLLDLGLGYLTLERSTPTLSPGELQRLRLATQVRSNLFGVVYVLDEPSAGLHPADTEASAHARWIGSRPRATRCSSSSTSST